MKTIDSLRSFVFTIRSTAKASVGVAAGAGTAAAAQLVLAVAAARLLGPKDYGTFIFAIGAGLVTGVIGCLGWQFAFNRWAPIFERERDWGRLHGLFRMADRTVYIACGAGAAGFLVFGLLVDHLAVGCFGAALLSIPFGVSVLRRQQLAGAGLASFGLVLDQGISSIAVLTLLLFVKADVVWMMGVYALAMVVGCVIATRMVRNRLPSETWAAKPSYDVSLWLRSSWSMQLGQFPRMLLFRMDAILLPAMAGLLQAGLYGAALRVTYFFTFPQLILQSLLVPMTGKAFAHGDIPRVRRLVLYSQLFCLATSAPFLVLICLWPSDVLGFMFGDRFRQAGSALVLITLGQTAMGFSNIFGGVMTMGGRERLFGRLNLGILIATLALAGLLIPRYGSIGGGIVCLVCGLALWSGQVIFSFPLLKQSAPAAAA
jgi:O-antigen/teichoic acid export membrane protein